MKILFVINPKSGTNQFATLEKLISDEFDSARLQKVDALYEYKIFKLQGRNIETALKTELSAFQPDIVGCAGGDGTINLVAGLLINSTVKVAIIPTGSANGMAKELGISDVAESLKLIIKGKTKPIDTLRVNNHTCIHLADVGFNARIVKRFEKDPRRGLSIYAKYLFNELFLIKKYRFTISYDGKKERFRAVSLTFANASKYGTGAVINPVGKLDDGKFELVIVKPFPFIKLFSITWKMFRGSLHDSEYVRVISCRKAHIFSSRRTTLQVDGEVIGRVKEIAIEILPKSISVIVP